MTQEEIENLNRPITSKEIESVIKKISQNRKAQYKSFPGEFNKYKKIATSLTPPKN